MMNWSILGIEPTKDKKAITAAYRAQLVHTNPEDKPEQFKALRAAYEQALELAERTDEEQVERDESPVGLWMEQVRGLYNDFPRRNRPECWSELLSHDVCVALDSRPQAEEALLRFFMGDYFIPQSVWQVLDREFSWVERREELYESFPRDFVDYAVVNGIRFGSNLPWELFIPGENAQHCDEYRRLYYKADGLPPEEMAPVLEQMAALSERHPYGEMLTYRMLLETDGEKAREGYKKLADEYPRSVKLQLEWAALCLRGGDWTQGEEYVRRALDVEPEVVVAREMLADCLANQGKYEDAKKLAFKLMDGAGGDQKRLYEINEKVRAWNEALIPLLEEQLGAQADEETKVKLAWCYLQNERNEPAQTLCRSIDPNYPDQYEYNNLMANLFYAVEDHAAALPYMQRLVEIQRAMESDGTEKTEERMAVLPEKLQMLGSCLLALEKKDEAMQVYEQALGLAPDDAEVLTRMGRLLCNMEQYERAAGLFAKVAQVLPGSYHGFYLQARCLYELGLDRDAFQLVNRALELEGSDLGVYVLKMRILLRNDAWEGVRSTVDFLREHGVQDEINVEFCEAQLLEFGEDKKEQALEKYRAIAARVEAGERLEKAEKLYFRLLVLEGQKLDARKSEDRAKLMALAEKGLACKEDDPACLDYKAWLLKREKNWDEALEIYHRLEKMPRRSMNVEQELAEIYYEALDRCADKALHYYNLLLEHDERADYHFYAGTCCRYLAEYGQGERHFLRAQELESDDIDGYNGLAYLYDNMKRYEDALEQINKVIEIVEKREGNQSRFYYHKARILRRLNRPEWALAVIDEVTEKYSNPNATALDKFEICCQFGLWDKAEQVLDRWNIAGEEKKRRAAARAELDLYNSRFDKARKVIKKAGRKFTPDDAERLTLMLAEVDGDTPTLMAIWEKRLQQRREKGQDITHALSNMAQIMWWSGRHDRAREIAEEALAELDKKVEGDKMNLALYRGRRCVMLAVLGRFDEAEAELAAVRELPLCLNCNYCTCKDADIYEANMEEIRGNRRRALELYTAGMERWHDDLDFICGIMRITREGL